MLFHILVPNLEKNFNCWLHLEYFFYDNCQAKKIVYCNYVSQQLNRLEIFHGINLLKTSCSSIEIDLEQSIFAGILEEAKGGMACDL